MSRLFKYNSSLQKFIKDRYLTGQEDKTGDVTLDSIIQEKLYTRLDKSSKLLSVMLLTIMNGQNKKNKVSVQGYYAATSIELLSNIIFIEDDKLINYIVLTANSSLCHNLETIKDSAKLESKMSSILVTSMKMFSNSVNYKFLLNKHVFILEDKKINNNLVKYYIKDHKDSKTLEEKFKTISIIKKDNYLEFLNKKILIVSELALCLGWILGGGDEKKLTKVKKAAKYFGLVHKLYTDFLSIDVDIKTSSKTTMNYIINYGLQDAYEFYMDSKQKFIAEAMTLDIYSDTVKEIINYIDGKVDTVIDTTSPDLKSSNNTSSSNNSSSDKKEKDKKDDKERENKENNSKLKLSID